MMNLSPALSQNEFQLIRHWIEKECGIVIGDDKAYLIENRLARLVAEAACDNFHDFYTRKLQSSTADLQFKTRVIDAMTTNETLWFRDQSPFNVLSEVVFPRLQEALNAGSQNKVRIWSAACSTGQEPYSIAMTAHEFVHSGKGSPRFLPALHITATDISSSALMLAKAGRYDEIGMSRGMLPNYRERYFTQEGRVAVVNEAIRKHVTFQSFNLQHPFSALGPFDVIFLRNVAIYFSPTFKSHLFDKIASVLTPGGVLIVGASESLTGYCYAFQLREHGKGLYYEVKSDATLHRPYAEGAMAR
jgi:chemotaxis protein methyltransferase CheR